MTATSAESDTRGRKCNRSQELEIESNFLHPALSLLSPRFHGARDDDSFSQARGFRSSSPTVCPVLPVLSLSSPSLISRFLPAFSNPITRPDPLFFFRFLSRNDRREERATFQRSSVLNTGWTVFLGPCDYRGSMYI